MIIYLISQIKMLVNKRLLNKPVQILSRDVRLSAYGQLTNSDLDGYVLLMPFEKDSIEAKTWPGVGNPFHIMETEIVGIFELINIHGPKGNKEKQESGRAVGTT